MSARDNSEVARRCSVLVLAVKPDQVSEVLKELRPQIKKTHLVLSIAAVLIMLWLLQREAAAKVSSLFFLTPALSAIEGAILFDEQLGVLALVGLAVALMGVALTLRSAR